MILTPYYEITAYFPFRQNISFIEKEVTSIATISFIYNIFMRPQSLFRFLTDYVDFQPFFRAGISFKVVSRDINRHKKLRCSIQNVHTSLCITFNTVIVIVIYVYIHIYN